MPSKLMREAIWDTPSHRRISKMPPKRKYDLHPFFITDFPTRMPHGYIEEQSTAGIPGLSGIVSPPPQPVVKAKAAVKFPLTTADRRFRSE